VLVIKHARKALASAAAILGKNTPTVTFDDTPDDKKR
jgi:hypothetical protein